jgi:rRNA processing protein Gar1
MHTTVTYMFSRGELRLQRLGRKFKCISFKKRHSKSRQSPKIGSEVVDENLNVIGKVFDIIGPVSAPYAVIKPNVKEPAKLLNKPVYLLLSKTKRSKNNDKR